MIKCKKIDRLIGKNKRDNDKKINEYNSKENPIKTFFS